jgi:hypothetical protein
LQPPSTCLAYWPCISSTCDQVGDLHWVRPDTSQSQGTYGVFTHLPLRSFAHGGMPLIRNTEGYGNYPSISAFPNRSVPTTQPSSSGIGWPSSLSSAWTCELQIYIQHSATVTPQVYFRFFDDADADMASEADVGMNPGRTTAGQIQFWSLGGSSPIYNMPSALAPANEWVHLALMKAAGAETIYVYIQGRLETTMTPTAPLSNIDKVRFQSFFSDDDHGIFIRELAFWSEARYPTTNGANGTAWTMPSDKQARWNSMMLP